MLLCGTIIANAGRDMSKYGECPYCGCELEAVWFTEEETAVEYDVRYYTGRVRNAIDYLVCPQCLRNYCVDDSMDGPWRYETQRCEI